MLKKYMAGLFVLWCLASCGGPVPELRFSPAAGIENPLRVKCKVLLGGTGAPFVFSFDGQFVETAGAPQGDTLVPMRCRFGDFTYYAEVPNQPRTIFDSRRPDDTTALGALRYLKGKSFDLWMGRNGAVVSSLPPSDSLTGFDLLAPEITEGLTDLHAVLPNGPVKQGDQWKSSVQTVVQGLELSIPLTWHCDQVLKDKALLSFQGACLPPAASEAYAAGSGTDVQAFGGRRGTATVELSTGKTLQLDLTDDLKAVLSVGGNSIQYTLGRQISVGR